MTTERNLNILSNFRILYLEDDKSLLTHTKDILDDFVEEVYAVNTSKEALEIIKTEKVDVISRIFF